MNACLNCNPDKVNYYTSGKKLLCTFCLGDMDYEDMMCSACDKQISKMYAEYEIRGIHHYEKNSFCCSAA